MLGDRLRSDCGPMVPDIGRADPRLIPWGRLSQLLGPRLACRGIQTRGKQEGAILARRFTGCGLRPELATASSQPGLVPGVQPLQSVMIYTYSLGFDHGYRSVSCYSDSIFGMGSADFSTLE